MEYKDRDLIADEIVQLLRQPDSYFALCPPDIINIIASQYLRMTARVMLVETIPQWKVCDHPTDPLVWRPEVIGTDGAGSVVIYDRNEPSHMSETLPHDKEGMEISLYCYAWHSQACDKRTIQLGEHAGVGYGPVNDHLCVRYASEMQCAKYPYTSFECIIYGDDDLKRTFSGVVMPDGRLFRDCQIFAHQIIDHRTTIYRLFDENAPFITIIIDTITKEYIAIRANGDEIANIHNCARVSSPGQKDCWIMRTTNRTVIYDRFGKELGSFDNKSDINANGVRLYSSYEQPDGSLGYCTAVKSTGFGITATSYKLVDIPFTFCLRTEASVLRQVTKMMDDAHVVTAATFQALSLSR